MEPRNLRLTVVQERDVDLLLLEEFCCSTEFRQWFAKEIGGAEMDPGRFVGAWHSVSNADSGESDIEVAFTGQTGRGMWFLIEDKIEAVVQPEQASRYRKRGRAYQERGLCEEFITVIVAPERYLNATPEVPDFDRSLSYESLRGWFLKESTPRAAHRAEILRLAIDPPKDVYRPIIDGPTTTFLRRYWEMAIKEAPELEMRPTGNRPKGSGWVFFMPSILPKGVRIVHKMQNGCVDMEFMGVPTDTLKERYSNSMPSGSAVVAASRSTMVRMRVPKVDPARDFTEQESRTREGQHVALRLLHWLSDQTRQS